MDKAEYQSRLEELNSLVKKEDYEGALAVVEAVDWRRVKSLRTLGMVADVYEANKRYPEAKKILLMAYDRSSIGKGILYRLVEVSVKMKDFDEAIDFYNEFEAVARHDNSRYLLKYKILRGQKAPLEEQISLLEEYKEREFTERWAYELANLYSKAGETQKCIDACDELILWFSEGKYVTKAMDLKMKYEPLSPSQQIKYEHRFDYKKNEEPSEDPEALEVRLAGESGAGEMAATKEPAETPEVKPVNGGVMSQYVAGEEEKEAGSPYEAYEKTQQAEADAEQVQEYEALQQTEEPIEEIPEEQAYADSTPTYLGNTIDLHTELAKSIRDVFSFRGKKQEETAVEEETSEEPVQYEVKDLEPEQLDVNVEVSPDANTTIKTRPQPKPKEKAEPVMPKAPKPRRNTKSRTSKHCSRRPQQTCRRKLRRKKQKSRLSRQQKPKLQSSRWIRSPRQRHGKRQRSRRRKLSRKKQQNRQMKRKPKRSQNRRMRLKPKKLQSRWMKLRSKRL